MADDDPSSPPTPKPAPGTPSPRVDPLTSTSGPSGPSGTSTTPSGHTAAPGTTGASDRPAPTPVGAHADAARAVEARETSDRYRANGDLAASRSTDGMVLALGQTTTFTVSFQDGMEDEIGPMRTPGAGNVSSSDTSIVDASVDLVGGGEPQALVTLTPNNPGEAEITYRYDDAEMKIPVKVVSRRPKSVAVNEDSVSRYAR